MACLTLNKSFKLACIGEGNSGGIKAIGVTAFINDAIVDRPTSGILTTLPQIDSIYRYEMKNSGNSFSETSTTDQNNRTKSYSGTLTAIINTLDPLMLEELYQLSKGEIYLFCELNAGGVILIGAKYGVITDYATNSGTDFASGQNATLTFTSLEDFPYLTLDSTAVVDYHSKIVSA